MTKDTTVCDLPTSTREEIERAFMRPPCTPVLDPHELLKATLHFRQAIEAVLRSRQNGMLKPEEMPA